MRCPSCNSLDTQVKDSRPTEDSAVIRRRRYKPVFVIDIAVPRDVDPAVNRLEGIFLYDIDDLQQGAAALGQLGQAALPFEEISDGQLAELAAAQEPPTALLEAEEEEAAAQF